MKNLQPRTGTNQEQAPIQAIPIMTRALFLVLRRRYLRGEVMDQYLSNDRMNRLKMEAVDAV